MNNQTKKKKEKTTKQTARAGTESQKWRSHGGLSVGREQGRMGGKGTGNKKNNFLHKIDRGRLRIV